MNFVQRKAARLTVVALKLLSSISSAAVKRYAYYYFRQEFLVATTIRKIDKIKKDDRADLFENYADEIIKEFKARGLI